MKLALVVMALMAVQTAAPRFDVTSIKVNRSGAPNGNLRIQPGGRLAWTNTTLRDLISTSHQRFEFDTREVAGGPDWIDRTRFDVLVQTGTGAPSIGPGGFPAELFAMIRTMLQERFGLVVHNETRAGVHNGCGV